MVTAVGASLSVMERDGKVMRGSGPIIFAQVKHGVAVPEIIEHIDEAIRNANA
jgi:urease accessory protein